MILLLLLAAQAPQVAPAAPPVASAPTSFSILEPVANEPCKPGVADKPVEKRGDDDIIVCARPLPSQKLPIYQPAERRGANPDTNGVGALNAEGTPCGARQGG